MVGILKIIIFAGIFQQYKAWGWLKILRVDNICSKNAYINISIKHCTKLTLSVQRLYVEYDYMLFMSQVYCIHTVLGNRAAKEGRFQDAILNFTEAITLFPDDHR